MSLVASFTLPARASRVRRCRSGARAAVESAGVAIPIGSSVRVKESITVFHAPKNKGGLQLQGLVGTVDKYSDLTPDGSAILSSTQPLVVRFEVPGPDAGSKPISFVTHMTIDEVDAVAGGAAAAAAGAAAGAGAKGGAAAGAAAGGAFAAQLAAGEVVQARRHGLHAALGAHGAPGLRRVALPVRRASRSH
jgi:hypothetical protein